jgi:hypothetical protein
VNKKRVEPILEMERYPFRYSVSIEIYDVSNLLKLALAANRNNYFAAAKRAATASQSTTLQKAEM